jgi:hypothetical protein
VALPAGQTVARLADNSPGLVVGLLGLQMAQNRDHREAQRLLVAALLLVGQTGGLLEAESLDPEPPLA